MSIAHALATIRFARPRVAAAPRRPVALEASAVSRALLTHPVYGTGIYAESYFKTCERDEAGRCTKGDGPAEQAEKPQTPPQTPAPTAAPTERLGTPEAPVFGLRHLMPSGAPVPKGTEVPKRAPDGQVEFTPEQRDLIDRKEALDEQRTKMTLMQMSRPGGLDLSKASIEQLDAVMKVIQRTGGKTDLCLVNPPVCLDNLGIEREDMPQIRPENFDAMVRGLKERGVKFEETTANVRDLKPTQNEMNGIKVLGIAKAMKSGTFNWDKTGPLYQSSDGYILDGHHRWAAQWLADPDRPTPMIKIDMPMKELLKVADKYSGPKASFYE